MAVTALTLTNPGGETGTTAGWSAVVGSQAMSNVATDGAVSPHGGTRFLRVVAGPVARGQYYQDVAVPGGITAAVDAHTIAVKLAAWLQVAGTSQSVRLNYEFYDAGSVLLGTFVGKYYVPTASWQQKAEYTYLPPLTRTIRIIIQAEPTPSTSFGTTLWIDDVTLDYSTAGTSDWPATGYDSQLGAYALATAPADSVELNQLGLMVVGAAETASGEHDIMLHQYGAIALVKRMVDRENLRAWQFPQDDHVFYVLQLGGSLGTLVRDSLTNQWSQWKSPNLDYWRGADGFDWEGINVCCDTNTGIIWQIDADGRLDYGDTPIESVVVGGMTERFRKHVPVYMAELALSEGQPSVSTDTQELGVKLEMWDGFNWTDFGTVLGQDEGEDITMRWYGLGLIKSPGTIFKLTDSGYARRIDGLNIEVPDQNG